MQNETLLDCYRGNSYFDGWLGNFQSVDCIKYAIILNCMLWFAGCACCGFYIHLNNKKKTNTVKYTVFQGCFVLLSLILRKTNLAEGTPPQKILKVEIETNIKCSEKF